MNFVQTYRQPCTELFGFFPELQHTDLSKACWLIGSRRPTFTCLHAYLLSLLWMNHHRHHHHQPFFFFFFFGRRRLGSWKNSSIWPMIDWPPKRLTDPFATLELKNPSDDVLLLLQHFTICQRRTTRPNILQINFSKLLDWQIDIAYPTNYFTILEPYNSLVNGFEASKIVKGSVGYLQKLWSTDLEASKMWKNWKCEKNRSGALSFSVWLLFYIVVENSAVG